MTLRDIVGDLHCDLSGCDAEAEVRLDRQGDLRTLPGDWLTAEIHGNTVRVGGGTRRLIQGHFCSAEHLYQAVLNAQRREPRPELKAGDDLPELKETPL